MTGSGGYIGMRPALNKGVWRLENSFEGFQHPFTTMTATGGTITTQTYGSYTFNIHTFSFTGSNQTFTITNKGVGGSLILTAIMWGGAGGGSSAEGYNDSGGAGGYASGNIDVSGMSSLIVQVGGGGGRGSNARPSRPYPSGGLNAVRTGYTSGCGGGRSGIFNSSTTASNALLIAGGGGGAGGHGGGGGTAGYGTTGGNGGGSVGKGGGNLGYSSLSATPGEIAAMGGTQSAPGSYQTTGLVGTAPAQLQGGDAGDGSLFGAGGAWNAAGGGGDGWHGGGASEAHTGGGGGSGYFNPNFVTSGSLQSTAFVGGKLGSINPPQTSSIYYSAGIAVGGANADGGNGKVVIIYRAS